MHKKLTTVCLLLLAILTTSLFFDINPVKASPTDLYDAFALKEYKFSTTYSPDYTFSKPSGSVFQAMSTDPGNGDAFIMIPFDKDYLNGKKLRIEWRWYYDYSNDYVDLSDVIVVDHDHNRRLINSGEFITQNGAEPPITSYTHVTACSYYATSNGGWINWRTDTSGILNLSGFSNSVVTVLIKACDPWIADQTGLQIDYLQVLDSSNTVLKQYDFNGNVFMDYTGSYYDYGLIRYPTCVLWGTSDYEEGFGGTAEQSLSSEVSQYVYGLFDDTGKYPYLENYWGSSTQPANVNNSVEYSQTYYDYSVFFYKGHYWKRNEGNYGDCGWPGCTYIHRGVVDNEGYQGTPVEVIKDWQVHDSVNDGKITASKTRSNEDFVFLWACMHGDPDWLGTFTDDDSWGMCASLMDIENANGNLWYDGYEDPQPCDHVFMSFDWSSPWYIQDAQRSPYNYGNFIYLFYYYAISQGYSVKSALDAASSDANGCIFALSSLKCGQTVWNNFTQSWDMTKLQVYGDGNEKLPR